MHLVYTGAADLGRIGHLRRGTIKTVAVLGRIAPEKGQLEFVRAVRMLRGNEPVRQFLIVGAASEAGNGYYRRVINETHDLGITFTGWQEGIDALANIDLLVVPSRSYEAAPRVILEAFSAGVPVLACPSGGIPELIEDDATGFLARGTTPGDIAERLDEVLRMSAHSLRQVAVDARRAWARRFTLARYRQEIWDAVLSTVADAICAAV